MSGDKLAPLWGPALFVYVLLSFGIVAFVVPRNYADASILRGALFGVVVYGVSEPDKSRDSARLARRPHDDRHRVGGDRLGDHHVGSSRSLTVCCDNQPTARTRRPRRNGHVGCITTVNVCASSIEWMRAGSSPRA